MTRHSVLAIDDDVTLLLGIQKRLEHEGYHVFTATNGNDAIEQIHSAAIDAVLLDVNMPGELSGVDVARALHEDPHTCNIPIIFVTGSADAEFKKKCAAVGARYFLAKPFDSDLLMQTLKGVFARDELADLEILSKSKRRQPTGRMHGRA